MIELCKIGMKQAAEALSRLVGKEVSVEAPRLCRLDEAESLHIPGDKQATAVQLRISGNRGGTMLILLGEREAALMLELLLGEAPAQGEPLSELQASALKEIGNIMGSAFLNAIGAKMKVALLPSVPTLLSGAPATLLREAARDQHDAAVAVETGFSVADGSCSGSFFLLPEQIPAQEDAAPAQ